MKTTNARKQVNKPHLLPLKKPTTDYNTKDTHIPKETVVIKQLSLEEALSTARDDDHAKFLERHIKTGENCFSCTYDDSSVEVSVSFTSKCEFAIEAFQLEEQDNCWKIQASQLKLVS